MTIAGIVFDLDGTLVDSRADIAAATNHVLRATGRQELGDEEICGYVGDGAPPLLARAARLEPDDPEVEELVARFLDRYSEHPADRTTLMPAAREVLDLLGAHPLAVCTNKPRRTAIAVLDAFALTDRFEVVVAGGDLPRRKPSPEPLCFIADQLDVRVTNLVMVGDGPQDVECGRRAGAHTVGVRGGILPIDRLVESKPDHLIETLAELPRLVTELQATN